MHSATMFTTTSGVADDGGEKEIATVLMAADQWAQTTKELGTRAFLDTGARRTLMGTAFLSNYREKLRKYGKDITPSTDPRPLSVFRFGMGSAQAIDRVVVPVRVLIGGNEVWKQITSEVIEGGFPALFWLEAQAQVGMMVDARRGVVWWQTERGDVPAAVSFVDGLMALELLQEAELRGDVSATMMTVDTSVEKDGPLSITTAETVSAICMLVKGTKGMVEGRGGRGK